MGRRRGPPEGAGAPRGGGEGLPGGVDLGGQVAGADDVRRAALGADLLGERIARDLEAVLAVRDADRRGAGRSGRYRTRRGRRLGDLGLVGDQGRDRAGSRRHDLRREDGQYVLEFAGPWTHTSMWEIPALAIITELLSRTALRGMGKFTLDVVYARAKAKLWNKVERLRAVPDLRYGRAARRRVRARPPSSRAPAREAERAAPACRGSAARRRSLRYLPECSADGGVGGAQGR